MEAALLRLGTIKALAAAFFVSASFGALTACMQSAPHRSVAAAPAPTSSSYGLFYTDEGSSAKLAYGEANSDNVDLMLQCAKGSRVVDVIDALQAKGARRLTLTSSGKAETLKIRAEDGEGGEIWVARTAVDDAPLSAFRRSGQLEVARGPMHADIGATADERVRVERFFAACGG